MWKFKEKEKEEEKPAPAAPARVPAPLAAPQEVRHVEPAFRSDVAHIGKSVIIKGELSGSEDLFLDGEVEGSIDLRGHSLTIGPNGRVRANIEARAVVVQGKVDGTIRGAERVELKKSAVLVGDIITQRIVIEDGALFNGGIDTQKEKEAAKPEVKPTSAAASASAVQGSLIEAKK